MHTTLDSSAIGGGNVGDGGGGEVAAPTMAVPATSAPLVLAAGGCLALVGFLLPESDYGAGGIPIILGLYVAGLLLLTLSGSRTLTPLLVDAYAKSVLLSCVILVPAAWWSSQYGDFPPVFMIDRFRPRADDYFGFEHYVSPAIGDSDVSLLDGDSNAPLHWWANVHLQNLLLGAIGRIVPLGANLMNVCIGAVTVAWTLGACHLALQRQRPDLLPLLRRMVRYCPWLIAASLLSIREIWVHCVFAAAVYLGFRAREFVGLGRIALLAVFIALGAIACWLLRPDMIPVVAVLAPICAHVPRKLGPVSSNSTTVKIVIVAGGLLMLGGLATLEPVQEFVIGQIQERALKYMDFSKDDEGEDESKQATLLKVTGDSIVLRGVVLTAWIWERPLPKVTFKPGSVYTAGMQLMPLWLLGFVRVLIPMLRRNRVAARDWWRTYRWLLLALLGTTMLIGFTSGEGRHAYNMIPTLCVLMAGALATCAPGDPELDGVLGRAAKTALIGFVVFSIFTLAVFGTSGMFPRN
jgi:hypothetical protein